MRLPERRSTGFTGGKVLEQFCDMTAIGLEQSKAGSYMFHKAVDGEVEKAEVEHVE